MEFFFKWYFQAMLLSIAWMAIIFKLLSLEIMRPNYCASETDLERLPLNKHTTRLAIHSKKYKRLVLTS